MEPTLVKPRHHRAALALFSLANAGALLAAAGLVLPLQPEDRISLRRGGALTALGLVYFVTLFEALNAAALWTAAGSRLRHRFKLSCGEVLDINNKAVSAVQALLCVLTGSVVCAWSCRRDLLRSSHYMSEAYAWFGAAYFFYDIWSMYIVHIYMYPTQLKAKLKQKLTRNGGGAALSSGDGTKTSNTLDRTDHSDQGVQKMDTSFLAYCKHEPVILFHHVFIGGFGFLVIVYLRGGLGDCVFGFVYLMELSTPLVSLRGALARLRLKDSGIYVANGLLMLVVFFFCRVASLPYVCYLYSQAVGLGYFEAIKSLPTGCKISISILLLPQLYWFYLMSMGAIKVLRKAGSVGSGGSAGSVGSAGGGSKRS